MTSPLREVCATAVFVTAALHSSVSYSAFYAGWGTLAFNRNGPDFSLCFAGDAVDKRPDRVLNVLDHVRHIEWAANIKFHPSSNKSIRIQSGEPLVAADWRCPDTSDSNGDPVDGDLGDIRVLLWTENNDNWWNTSPVGGYECSIINPSSSWGATGNEPHLSKWCNFNLKLGDDAPSGTQNFYLNHTLHEFGHKLGLAHGHDRSDSVCTGGTIENGTVWHEPNFSGTIIDSNPSVFMTSFDKDSVMNYKNDACGHIGNYGFTGYSEKDRLALRILFPEDNRIAESNGVRVVKTGESLQLYNRWKSLGAMIDDTAYPVASQFVWTIDGIQEAVTPDFDASLSEGMHNLEYTYQDFLGRTYSSQSKVEVLSPEKFNQRMASQAVIIGANIPAADTTSIVNSIIAPLLLH
jgi:hypothetical protein